MTLSRKKLFFPTFISLFLLVFILPFSKAEATDPADSPCGTASTTYSVSTDTTYSVSTEFHPCLLSPLPIPGENPKSPTFVGYLTFVYRFAIAAAALLAVGQIVLAGIQRIAGGISESQIADSKSRINNALIGLGLALSSYLILYTINPSLAEIKLKIPDIEWKVNKAETPSDTATTTGRYATGLANMSEGEKRVREELKDQGILLNNGDNFCPEGVSFEEFHDATGGNCTTVEGLDLNTVDFLKSLLNECSNNGTTGCEIKVTGGTERGHQTHGPSCPYTVDLDKNDAYAFTKFIKNKGVKAGAWRYFDNAENSWVNGSSYTYKGATFADEGSHWHMYIGGICHP